LRRVLTAGAVVAAVITVPLTPTASAAAPYQGADTAAVQDDFNGDGYRDLVVGAPYAANGLTTARAVGYTQDTADVPGAVETGDQFGAAVHLADLNRDGKAETVVGAPTENSDGCVWIARGSASGPVPSGSFNLCGKSAGIRVYNVKGYFGAATTSVHAEL
jgi:FG-GAP-like repeat